MPLQVRLYLHSEMTRVVAQELAVGYDAMHASLVRMAPYLPGRGAPVHRHLDLMDSFAINMRTRAERSPALSRAGFAIESRLLGAYEAEACAAADSASVIGEGDRAAPGLGAAAIVPNGVDESRFPFRPDGRAPDELVFFGNLGYFHNIEPCVVLARQVLPRIREARLGVRLRLIGDRPAARVRELDALPGVEVTGRVPDMAAAIERATVAVLPMTSGSGVKNKILESFASGLPVVTTEDGARGIEGAKPGRELLLAAAEPAAFAAETLRALDAPALRSRLAHSAHALVRERYSWARAAQKLLSLYGESPRPRTEVPVP